MFIRVDANNTIGNGHFMRCIALAQAWEKIGGEITFISACETEILKNRIKKEGYEFFPLEYAYPNEADLEQTINCIRASSNTNKYIALDGYHFDTHYQKCLKDISNSLLIIDDTAHLDHYVADIILNQNIIANDLTYSCDPETTFLLGTDYVLLRDEFLFYKNWNRKIQQIAKRILVSLGGSDSKNITLEVLCALDQVNVDGLETKVIVGPNNLHLSTLIKAVRNSKHKIDLLQNVSNMPDLMIWADMAISSAGSTCWELAYLGLPAILIISSANQAMNLESLEKNGAVNFVSNRMSIPTKMISREIHDLIMKNDLRNDMSYKGKLLVDGNGSERVVQAFQILNKKAKDNNERENTTVNI